jgi:hypothetical protein
MLVTSFSQFDPKETFRGRVATAASRPFRSVSANAALLESGRHTGATLSATMGAILGIRMRGATFALHPD